MNHKTSIAVRVLMMVAGGTLLVAALSGCGRVTSSINSISPDVTSPVRVEVGKSVPLTVTFTNTGNRNGTFYARAVMRDSANVVVPLVTQRVNVDRGKQTTVTWDHIVTSPGTYTVQFTVGKDESSTQTLAPSSPAQLIIAVPAVPSTKFRVGDRVQVTSPVRVRTGPGVENPMVSHVNYRDSAPKGVEGKVVGGPDRAGEYIWWRVEFDAGYVGWCIEDNLSVLAGG